MKREAYIDHIKGFAIIFVVLGHLLSTMASQDKNLQLDSVIRIISIFQLSLFFIVSGMLLPLELKKAGKVTKSFLTKKIRKIMTPYLMFGLIFLWQHRTPQSLMYFLTGYGISVLWFLSTLLLSELITLALMMVRLFPVRITLSLSLLVLAFSIGPHVKLSQGGIFGASVAMIWVRSFLVLILRALVAQFFVSIGVFLTESVLGAGGKTITALMMCCFAIGAVSARYAAFTDWRDFYFQRPFFWSLSATGLSVGFVLFFRLFKDRNFRLLGILGKHSLFIMCTHLEFNIIPTSIGLGYRLNAYIPFAKQYCLIGSVLFFLTVFETALCVILRYLSAVAGPHGTCYERKKNKAYGEGND